MKPQRITVSTKGGLLAAFECAKDFPGFTHIKLIRKTGISEIKLGYATYVNTVKNNSRTYTHGHLICSSDICFKHEEVNWYRPFSKRINKAKAQIRKIPAKELFS